MKKILLINSWCRRKPQTSFCKQTNAYFIYLTIQEALPRLFAKTSRVVTLILLAALCTSYVNNVLAKEIIVKKVFISQVVKHPALDATTQGIIDGLEQNGYKSGLNLELKLEFAQANPALAAQIAAKFCNQTPDLVVGVGTISALSFVKYIAENKVKMIFSTITDPLGAGLVPNLGKPGNNTTGVSNFVKLQPQIKLFQKIQPKLKRLGILYNPGELNSVSIVKRLEKVCPKLGITLIKQTINTTAEVGPAATKLAANIDAIFISNDNTALSALQSVILAANKMHIPVYVSDTAAVELGALAALGPNQYQIGLQTGKMIARALNGESLSQMPVEFPNTTSLVINESTAKKIDLTIPESIKQQAANIIKVSKL